MMPLGGHWFGWGYIYIFKKISGMTRVLHNKLFFLLLEEAVKHTHTDTHTQTLHQKKPQKQKQKNKTKPWGSEKREDPKDEREKGWFYSQCNPTPRLPAQAEKLFILKLAFWHHPSLSDTKYFDPRPGISLPVLLGRKAKRRYFRGKEET